MNTDIFAPAICGGKSSHRVAISMQFLRRPCLINEGTLTPPVTHPKTCVGRRRAGGSFRTAALIFYSTSKRSISYDSEPASRQGGGPHRQTTTLSPPNASMEDSAAVSSAPTLLCGRRKELPVRRPPRHSLIPVQRLSGSIISRRSHMGLAGQTRGKLSHG